MATHKKTKKKHQMRRNAMRRNAAVAPAALPRAIARLRKPTPTEQLEAEKAKQWEDSRGWRLASGVGGAAVTSVLGLVLDHQNTRALPWVTAALAGAGIAVALGAPNRTARSIGVGAAAAGTTLLGTLADRAWFPRDGKSDEHVQGPSPGTAKPMPGKKPSNATDIPADALARAYERARLRMALASEPTN